MTAYYLSQPLDGVVLNGSAFLPFIYVFVLRAYVRTRLIGRGRDLRRRQLDVRRARRSWPMKD